MLINTLFPLSLAGLLRLAVITSALFVMPAYTADAIDCDKSSCNDLAEHYLENHNIDMAAKAYIKGCELDDGASCSNIARFYADGETAESDFAKALPLYIKGCKLHNSDACFDLAYRYDDAEDYTNALIYYNAACKLNDGDSCQFQAGILENNIAPADLERATALYTKACELQNSDACTDLGDRYDDAEDYTNALVYYDAACELNDGYGCHRQAWILGNDIKLKNLGKATELYAKGCELENGGSCNNLGVDYMDYDKEPNPYTHKDYAKGIELLILACDSYEEGRACTHLSDAYTEGHGVKKNLKESLRYSIKACVGVDETYGGGCFDVGNFYEEGEGVKKDAEKANYYYEKGCELDNSSACLFAAKNHEKGDGVQKSKKRAQDFYQQACDLSDDDGCNEVAD